MRVKVVFDRAIFRRQRFGGISEYWRHLTESIQNNPNIDCGWDIDVPFSQLLPNLSSNAVFHSSYYRYSMGFGTKTITTVHDFIHERGLVSTISSSRARFFSYLKQRALERSAAVVCVSESTATDLRHFYPSVASRVPIYVIHHGPTLSDGLEDRGSTTPEPSSTIDPFFLFVGRRRDEYKNFDLVLQGLTAPVVRTLGTKLLVVGDPFTAQENLRISKLGLSGVVENAGNISNQVLRKHYERAVALIYPSSYEGFGLPVLDAMYVGCPVIAASIPAIREVAGDAAEYLEISDPDSLPAALTKLLSPTYRTEMRTRGLLRSRLYSWRKAAMKYVAAYQDVASA